VAPDERHAQEVDLVEEGLEALVLCDPSSDLRDSFFGDVNGACLAVVLEGEMLSRVEWAPMMASASRSSTAVGIGGKRGRQDGGIAGEFFEPSIEHASDERGVFWYAHGRPPNLTAEKSVQT